MKNIDSPPSPQSSHEAERSRREELREELFQTLVAGKVLEEFLDDLFEAGIEGDALKAIGDAFAKLSENNKLAVLAIPASLRPRRFATLAQKMEKGEITAEEIIESIRTEALEKGYTVGYHLSPADIKPGKDDWSVQGTEADHRDGDLPRAYYSLSYRDRYLKKPMRFLYVIRANVSENSEHRQDNNGSWGRASTLPIVAKIDMIEVEKELDERMKALEKAGE
jgi:hypothetical protein